MIGRFLILCFLSSAPVFGEGFPYSVSLFNPIQFPPADRNVWGLRKNLIYGNHVDVVGLDLGLINHSTGTFTGIGIGGFANSINHANFILLQFASLINISRGEMTLGGLQFAGISNQNYGNYTIVGFEISGLMNASSDSGNAHLIGVQLASLLNSSPNTKVYGIQASIFNSSKLIAGLQVGLVNLTKRSYGIQVGLFNMAEELNGIQLGLINVHLQSPLLFFPGLRIGF